MSHTNESTIVSVSNKKNAEVDLSIVLAQPRFEIPENCLENCPICMEDILGVNISITTCGHAFHCFCLLTAVERNEECPLCRHPLIKIDYETDEDDEEDGDENDEETINSSSDASEEQEEEDSVVSLEQLTNKIINLGYTMKDLIYMLTPIQSDDPKHTEQYEDGFFEIIEKIKDGRIPLSQRDTRTYSQVVRQEEEVEFIPELIPKEQELIPTEEIFDKVMETIDIMITRIDTIHTKSITPVVTSSVIQNQGRICVEYKWEPEKIVY